jgi:phosphatidylglycerophosphatase A
MMNRISVLVATFLGIGFAPIAPGTLASIATTLVFYGCYSIGHRILPELHLSAIGLVTVIGVLTATRVSELRNEKDPSCVVIDEVAGQLLTFLFLPVHFWNLVLGTIFFRVFDIWKPFPVRQLENLEKGVGIMADDLMAGIYSLALLFAVNRLLHW